MHYAISHQTLQHDFLHSTSRRKLLKHTLLHVKQGLVLAKLGKLEYALEPGESFWLPFDTLTSLTFFPNTSVQSVEVSCRVSAPLPKQAGYVELGELSRALINRLGEETSSVSAQNEIMAVLKTELTMFKPALNENALTHQFSQWRWDGLDSALSNEQQLVLKVREANKMMLSGKKREQVVELLFAGNDAIFVQLEHLLLGKS